MPVIHLTTIIKAPIERVFDLSRSIDLHQVSMAHTKERAVAGKTSGLIEQGEWVTWEAKHLFKKRYLTVVITSMQPYTLFIDEMRKGDFKIMRHEHSFEQAGPATKMTDVFRFKSPYGWIGNMADALFLTNYMKRLLQQRNNIIKQFAETERWKSVLPMQSNI
jgi:ligand-binding SRPBCC domain-containing protein